MNLVTIHIQLVKFADAKKAGKNILLVLHAQMDLGFAYIFQYQKI